MSSLSKLHRLGGVRLTLRCSYLIRIIIGETKVVNISLSISLIWIAVNANVLITAITAITIAMEVVVGITITMEIVEDDVTAVEYEL